VSEPGAKGRRAATRLRLVSWNVHGTPDAPQLGERMRAIARVISARKPDLVLLQEVWRRRDAEAFEKRLGRKGYAAVRAPAAGGPARGSGLLGFARASVGWRVGEPRFHEPGVEAFSFSRSGFSCEVLNTHVQAGDAALRRAQLAELRDLAEVSQGRPVLVAGDLDTTPDEPAWQEVGALRDLTASAREACACGTSVRPGESARWIDHLLAKLPDGWDAEAEVSLLRSLRPDVPYSDHHGLDAVLEITAPANVAPLAALAAARLAGPTTRRELLANAALWWVAR
jgi:endonuclease/exonuclease/phosphatase family metal-dependent hydrolase